MNRFQLDSTSTYHFEYTNIHNQRIALVKIIHLWHQIGFPASLLIFGFFLNYGLSQKVWLILFVGAVISTMVICFVRIYALRNDRAILSFYPRIITIEIMLDYHFYRDYLRKKGKDENKFIEICENISAENPEDFWNKVSKEFKEEYFPSKRRGHDILNNVAWIMVISFFLISIVGAIYITCPYM